MPEVVIENLHKNFGDVTVLKEVSVTVRDGEFFTLLGPSGCGKSTTLNCIAGLEEPTGGRISVGEETFVDGAAGVFLDPEARNLGMVFQSYALWPHKSIAENLALPLRLRKIPREEQKRMIHDALDRVGLADLTNRFPHQLSGGQQQRVALARALVYSPTVLLLDEPLSNLDAKLREQARAWLKRLQQDLGITTVYVTHDQEEALALSDRIAVMSDGEMLQVGTPHEIYETPATAAVAAFVGSCNFLIGEVIDVTDSTARVRLDACNDVVEIENRHELTPRQEVTVAVRPEQLSLVPPDAARLAGGNRLAAEIITSSYVGSRYDYQVRLGDRVVQTVSPRGDLSGDVVLTFDPARAQIYPSVDAGLREAQELLAVSP